MQSHSWLRCFYLLWNHSELGKWLPLCCNSFRVAVWFVERLWSGGFCLQVLCHRSEGNSLDWVLRSPYCTLSMKSTLNHMNPLK